MKSDLELYMSINEYNECYIHLITKNTNKDDNITELPYDIAEELCTFFSKFGYVELEDEYGNIEKFGNKLPTITNNYENID